MVAEPHDHDHGHDHAQTIAIAIAIALAVAIARLHGLLPVSSQAPPRLLPVSSQAPPRLLPGFWCRAAGVVEGVIRAAGADTDLNEIAYRCCCEKIVNKNYITTYLHYKRISYAIVASEHNFENESH